MPLELSTDQRVAALNARFAPHDAATVMELAMCDRQLGRITLVSSFGAESVVLLHLLAQLDRALPVLFIDTEMLFPETLAYQRDVTEWLGLTNVQTIRADAATIRARDPMRALRLTDPDACCALRKTAPLQAALASYDTWVNGRKRFQGSSRARLNYVEADAAGRIKINPLVHWSTADLQGYMTQHDLPRHPLVAKGYPSIGCAPCTTRVRDGEDPRAGRWRDQAKDECGIHIVDGKVVPIQSSAA